MLPASASISAEAVGHQLKAAICLDSSALAKPILASAKSNGMTERY
jgi:hypothetical protein